MNNKRLLVICVLSLISICVLPVHELGAQGSSPEQPPFSVDDLSIPRFFETQTLVTTDTTLSGRIVKYDSSKVVFVTTWEKLTIPVEEIRGLSTRAKNLMPERFYLQTLVTKDTSVTGRVVAIDSSQQAVVFQSGSKVQSFPFRDILVLSTKLPDFKTIMLLLTVALGLSLTVERLLQGLKWLIKRLLLRDETPFQEAKAPTIEFVLSDMGFDKLNNWLDDKVEDIQELQIQELEAADAEKPGLQQKALATEKKALDTIAKFKSIISDNLENKHLTQKQKDTLKGRLRDLDKIRIKTAEDGTLHLNLATAEYNEEFSEATALIDPITPRDPEKTATQFWVQIFGTFVGIVICYYSEFGIFNYIFGIENWADFLLTGILIGGGAGPIHTLIMFLTERKVSDIKVSTETDMVPEEHKAPESPAVIRKPERLVADVDIPYQGGVDREKLETVHLRRSNPDLIIYHHTAMHSDTTFADVVKVIKDKGWSTGYNCVILKDGSIHPFCRWDRYGNHAKGHNRHSLGIAFNGNFEPNPQVSFSNVNGRLGILKPTDIQLRAACKVVALWCHLYDIPLDFANSVIPHNQVANKACPGSNFPYDQFKSLVDTIYNGWQNSAKAQEELSLYKQKQFLYV